MDKSHRKVESRNERFAKKASTRIWKEESSPTNPYIAERCLCHGYDMLQLACHRSYMDMVYLLIQGELPTPEQHQLLETLMITLSNPGPRHPATRAAMNAAVSKADTAHILPIGLAIMGGDYLGGGEVEAAMRFLRKHLRQDPAAVVEELLIQSDQPMAGDWHMVPGFGRRFGEVDPMAEQVADLLLAQKGAGKALAWGEQLVQILHQYGHGWLFAGAAAAAFLDLGFHPRAGAGLFQLASAPGLLAHGLEMANKPVTAMPFVDEDHYFIHDTANAKSD